MGHLIAYCRAGFEKECARELVEQSRAADLADGETTAEAGSAFVTLKLDGAISWRESLARVNWRTLVFARQLWHATARLTGLSRGDRISPLLRALPAEGRFCDVWIEHPDSQAGRVLSPLARALTKPLRQNLNDMQRLADNADARLHVLFDTSAGAWLGAALTDACAPWPLGIPRLKMPVSAPSRSTLKLEEALYVFLTDTERRQLLKPGMTAVDLGAAPGGWTWQMTRRGLRVIAVDNGAMDRRVMNSGDVEHLRADGFTFKPRRRVDWLLCDMVEQPSRIAQLMATWFKRGDCRCAIFNLKLPMKRRYEEFQRCRALIEAGLRGRPHSLRFKQLYHDREEVTGFFASTD
ncbi:MAG TPA: 23S rRNA (cytidine(2498)-2'-O)-methyltransferase RlmM [Gammaproteobacteria bacterium]|nr:23S rRNA (cytidine(2498)-2'-O)-methyltransferase RlmM [Gammaproteobacteria bacterium]